MEPVTHILTGACLAKAGFNRKAAYATLAMAVAAELPDIDTVWSLRGPVEGFAHHRGITHTFLGLPFEAAIVVGAAYGLHRWRVTRAAKVPVLPDRVRRPLTKAPVRWGYLYGCVLVALLSHLLLDYTNNYGLRPFFPFNPHWYAASITFIFDPLMFVLLLMPMAVPPLLGMVSAEVGAKRNPFRGQGLAITALMCVVALWGLRFVEHRAAEQLALQQTYDVQEQPAEVPAPMSASPSVAVSEGAPASEGAAAPETELIQPPGQMLRVQRVSASPDPVNPFHWAVAMDFGQLYQLADVDTLAADVAPSDLTYPKLTANVMTRAAQDSPLGRAYMDWSSMPILTEEQTAPTGVARARPSQKLTFRDPRFMGDVTWLRTTGSTPLTGVVLVDDSGQVLRQTMDGRREPAGHHAVREVDWDPALVALWVKATSSNPKAAVMKPVRPEVAASKPVVATPTAIVPASAPTMSAVAPAPVSATTPAPANLQPVKTEPAKTVVTGSTTAPPSGPPVAEVVKAAPAPVIAPPPTPAPVVAKAVPPQPVVAPKPVIVVPKKVEVAKTVPTKSGPGVFERGETKVSVQYQRFRNWIRWLTSTK